MPQFSGVVDVMVVDHATRSYKAHATAASQELAIEKALDAVDAACKNLGRLYNLVPRAWTEVHPFHEAVVLTEVI